MTYSPAQLEERIRDAARQIGFPEAIAVIQLRRESANYRSDVVYGNFVGGAGERGLAQFTPGTWTRFGSGDHRNAYNPDTSLAAWQRYIQYLRGLFGEDYWKILAGYNGGEGHVSRGTVSSAARRYANEVLAQAGATAPAPTPQNPPDPTPTATGINWWLVGGVVVLTALVLLDD